MECSSDDVSNFQFFEHSDPTGLCGTVKAFTEPAPADPFASLGRPAPVADAFRFETNPSKHEAGDVLDGFAFAPGFITKSSKHTGVAPFGDDAHEPAKRTEFHFYKNLQLDDEDEAEEPGSFRKRRTDFSVGTHVRWLKAAKTFVITKALYTARGLYLIHGTKDDDSGTIMGIFSPSELAALPARF